VTIIRGQGLCGNSDRTVFNIVFSTSRHGFRQMKTGPKIIRSAIRPIFTRAQSQWHRDWDTKRCRRWGQGNWALPAQVICRLVT